MYYQLKFLSTKIIVFSNVKSVVNDISNSLHNKIFCFQYPHNKVK